MKKTCLQCASTNITAFSGEYHTGPIELIHDKCQDCGNISLMPEMDEKAREELRMRVHA